MTLKWKRFFQTNHQSNIESTGLLILRIIVGVAFIFHGSGKISNPFGWMPPNAGVPGFFQMLAAISEFGGGIALLLGLLTRLGALGLCFTMTVATSMHAFVLHDPFVNLTGGSSFEPALGYLGIAILFLTMGPGKFSVDHKVFGDKNRS